VRTLFCLVAATSAAHAAPTATVISWEITHEPDGKKYPNQVKESYSITRDGKLSYGAYFGGMPIDMNHNDRVEWRSGEAGQRLFAAVQSLLSDQTSGLHEIPDSESAPDGSYNVTVRNHDADSTRIVNNRKSRAWALIHARFDELIAAFEVATHRPKKPGELSQHH
jgi:hypothetical protein